MSYRFALGLALVAFSLSFALPRYARAADYCLAIRGNGELAPAHWGALAKVVEQKGLPSAMAGGSSASINMFLLESIAMNPLVTNAPDATSKKLAASLLIKSLQGYLEVVASHPEWQETASLVEYLKQQTSGSAPDVLVWLKRMAESDPQALIALVVKNETQIRKSLELATRLGLINPEALRPVQRGLLKATSGKTPAEQAEGLKSLKFYAGEAYQSAVLFGKFNAETDQNIFFRQGVVNFQILSSSFSSIANFYAGREMTPDHLKALTDFNVKCAAPSEGKLWNTLRGSFPECDRVFKQLVTDYQQSGLPMASPGRFMDKIGAVIPAFPSTSVLKGNAYATAKKAIADYAVAMDPEFGRSFQVNESDVAFGYWGQAPALARIQKNLATPFRSADGTAWDFSQDEKSRRFLALGEATWQQAISTSPAEPGLAPLQEIVTPQGLAYSAGGWSDLHPGAVLKAAGCDDIVYVTRRGGESLFGQGVAKRLLGFKEVPWDHLSTEPGKKAANVFLNNTGDTSDMTSTWSRLYNLANPDSSYNTALKLFNNVVCTDWNRFDIQKSNAVHDMIKDAYEAPWTGVDITAKDNAVDPVLGYRPYAGCLAF